MSTNIKKSPAQKISETKKSEYRVYSQIIAGCIANVLLLCGGMAFGWPAAALPKLLDKSSDLHLTSDQGAWLVSALPMGACVAPIISALVVDRIGRKWFLYACGIPYLLAWLLTYFARSFEFLFVARLICGLGVGGAYSALPIYLGEIAETRIRGALGTMTTLMLCFGSLVSYSVGPWVDEKALALINLTPTVLFLLTFIWMPESPYYYLKKKRLENAEQSLAWLRRSKLVCEELMEMSTLIEEEARHRGGIKELVTVPANRKATFITWLLLSAQQFSGIIAFMSYATLLFEKTSLNFNPDYGVIIMGLVSFLSNCVSTSVVDKAGKRPLFLLSASGASMCLCATAIYFYLDKSGVDVSPIAWIPLASTLLFQVFFSLGLGPLPYAVLSEVYPTTVKALASTIASIYGAALGVFVSKIYQIVADEWGYHTVFFGLCACEAALACTVFFVLPETSGKSFKEIQKILDSSSAA